MIGKKMTSKKDSLRVTEEKDGSFTIEWDSDDPAYSWLNGKTEEELTKILTEQIENYLSQLKENG
jgi:hypothetical protein